MAKIPIGEIVIISKEDLAIIRKWAHDHRDDFFEYGGRTPEEREENIFLGKVGEYAKYLMYKKYKIKVSDLKDIFKSHKNSHDDGGYDLIVNNLYLEDVKSIDSKNRKDFWQVAMNSKNLRADVYSLCWVNLETGVVEYVGALTTEEIINKNLLREGHRKSNNKLYYYFDQSNLKELDENFE
jgi:hypothetical protein